MSQSTIQQLADFGQSIWLDYINRAMLENGQLNERIKKGLRGMTSNPSIFNQVISSSSDYDERIVQLKNTGKSTFEIYDELTIKDIQDAADCFYSVYQKTNQLDGYVSLEINPQIAHKVDEQVKEGLRLFKKVERKNVMIKVPATQEGICVVEELIAHGVNVNVTLIFSLQQYEQTVFAYFRGLEKLAKVTPDLSDVRSVASVFVSRIDAVVDKLLDEKISQITDQEKKTWLKSLKGKAAVANCRIIFEKFKELFSSEEYKYLNKSRAQLQRVLWGSTSTKNPEYSDIKYVTELIAQPSVNTVPENTLNAFLDHGVVKDAFVDKAENSFDILKSLKENNIDIDDVNKKLLKDGVKAFDDAFLDLTKAIDKKAAHLITLK